MDLAESFRSPWLAPKGRFTVPARGGFILLYRGPFWVEVIVPRPEDLEGFGPQQFRAGRRLGLVRPDPVTEEPHHSNLPTYRLDLDPWFEQGDGVNLVLNYFAKESEEYSGSAWIQRSTGLTVAYAGVPGTFQCLYLDSAGSRSHGLEPHEFFRQPAPVRELQSPPALVWLSQQRYQPGQSIWGCLWVRERASQRGWDLRPDASSTARSLTFQNGGQFLSLTARPIAPGFWELSGQIPAGQVLGEYAVANARASFLVVSADAGPLSLEVRGENTPEGLLVHFQLPRIPLENAPQTIGYKVSWYCAGRTGLSTYRDFILNAALNPRGADLKGQISLPEAQNQSMLLRWQRPPDGVVVQVEADWGPSKSKCRLEYPSFRSRLGLKLVHLGGPGEESLVEVVITDSQGRARSGYEVKLGFRDRTYVMVDPEGNHYPRERFRFDWTGMPDEPKVTFWDRSEPLEGWKEQSLPQPVWRLVSKEVPVTLSVVAPFTSGGATLSAEFEDSDGHTIRSELSLPRVPPGRLPAPLPLRAELDRASYQVGETAVLTVRCPGPRAHGALRIWSGGLLEHRWLEWEGEELSIPLEVSMEHTPAFQVEVSLFGLTGDGLRGHWLVVEANVEHPQRQLQVRLRVAHEVLGARAEQRAFVEVEDHLGRPVAGARIALCAADARVASQTPQPVDHFYPRQPYRGQLHTSWHNNPLLDPAELERLYRQGLNLCYSDQPDWGRIGVSDPPRADFSATAFASAELVSDEGGRAQVSFAVGERLAPFVMTAVVVGPDEAWGTARASYEVTGGLTLHPVLPAFLRTGDRLQLPVLVGNPGDTTKRVRMGLRTSGSLTCAQSAFECQVPAAGGAEVTFELAAGSPGGARVGLMALGGGESDHLEFSLEVLGNRALDAFGSLEWGSCQVLPHPGQLTQRFREFVIAEPSKRELRRMNSLPYNVSLTEDQYNFGAVLHNCLEVAFDNLEGLKEWSARLQLLVEYVVSGCPKGGDIAGKTARAEVLWTACFCASLQNEFEPCRTLALQFLQKNPLEPALAAWEVLMERPGAIARFESSLEILATAVDSPERKRFVMREGANWLYPVALLALLQIDPEHPLIPHLLWAAWTPDYPYSAVECWIWYYAQFHLQPGILLEQTLLKPALPCHRGIDQGMALDFVSSGLEREGNLMRGRVGQRVVWTLKLARCGQRGACRCIVPIPAGLEVIPEPPRSALAASLFPDKRTDYVDRIEFDLKENILELNICFQVEGILGLAGSFEWPGARIYELDRPSCWGATADLRLQVQAAEQ